MGVGPCSSKSKNLKNMVHARAKVETMIYLSEEGWVDLAHIAEEFFAGGPCGEREENVYLIIN